MCRWKLSSTRDCFQIDKDGLWSGSKDGKGDWSLGWWSKNTRKGVLFYMWFWTGGRYCSGLLWNREKRDSDVMVPWLEGKQLHDRISRKDKNQWSVDWIEEIIWWHREDRRESVNSPIIAMRSSHPPQPPQILNNCQKQYCNQYGCRSDRSSRAFNWCLHRVIFISFNANSSLLPEERYIVGISGAPGSGKTTIAARVVWPPPENSS